MIKLATKYRCMSCPGTPYLDVPEGMTSDEVLMDHLTENIGHEVTIRITSCVVADPEPEEN